MHAWVNPDQAAIAVVYEHPVAGAWMDFVSRYDDGTRITFTNTGQGGGLDHQPGHLIERRPGLDPRSLYQEFFEARPERPAIPVRADEFVAVFEKAYADEMDWRNGRGGPTEREIRAIAAESGFEDDDALVEATRERMQEQALDDLDATLRQRFSRETSLSVAEWERVRDRLVIVHDRLTPERLDETAAEWVDEDVPGAFGRRAGEVTPSGIRRLQRPPPLRAALREARRGQGADRGRGVFRPGCRLTPRSRARGRLRPPGVVRSRHLPAEEALLEPGQGDEHLTANRGDAAS